MNGRLSKKINRATRRAWREYYNSMCNLPFMNRIHLCWNILHKDRMD